VAAGTAAQSVPAGERRAAKGGDLGRWPGGIVLEDVVVVQEKGGVPVTLQLTWRADAIGQRDYTLFVQALGADGVLAAQVDRQPGGGAAPTSTWLQGERFVERVTLAGAADGRQQIIAGWYDVTGKRLPLADGAGGDHLVIWQAAVPVGRQP
jgi:hypothetical protein